jgi:hypothetical protein
VGARPAAIDGAISSGGGNGERGNERGGEGRGWGGVAPPFRVEWRGTGGELVAGGE